MPVSRQNLKYETAAFLGLLFIGVALMPMAIFAVGQAVFGTYGGVGYSDFFSTLSIKVRHGDWVAWFLILSPYMAWQCLRLMGAAWRASSR
jgi:hypothetical protein